MIQLENLRYTYPGARQPALDGLTLAVPEGQFCALIGPNEAGKSTLCYTLTGFIPHYFRGTLAGTVRVAGMELPGIPLSQMVTQVGLVFQDPFNQITGARLTVRGEVAFGLENLGLSRQEILERTEEVLEMVGLAELADRSPFGLSGGQQQRVAIASILVMRPRVLVLDEPTSQLDPLGRREFFETLTRLRDQRGVTILLVEHHLEWIGAFADRVVALDRGRIVLDDSPRAVLSADMLESIGVGRTRYTRAAQRAQEAGLVDRALQLPVTLEQAVEYFRSLENRS